MTALLRLALFLVITLVVAELALRAVALFAHGRQTAWRPDAHRRVLCVGDSHTYGALVSADDSYPGHLQRVLDERQPRTWSVINLGIPGMNTAQVKDQLRSGVARYRPELVIVWSGVNNSWNRSVPGQGRETWRAWLERIALRLRVYRLIRVWVSDRSLNRLTEEVVAAPGQRYNLIGKPNVFDTTDRTRTVVVRDGHAEEIRFVGGEVGQAEIEDEAGRDYRAMIDAGREAGVRVTFIAYPIDEGAFQSANRAVRRVAKSAGVEVLESADAVRRVPLEQRQFLWGAHPNGPMYAEIARDLAALIVDGAVAVPQSATAGGPLARSTFSTEEGRRTGPCSWATTGCPDVPSCYRWNPSKHVCNIELPLASRQVEVRASWRMRVASPPTATGGSDLFSLIEKAYGTGLRVEFADAEHLRIASFGSGGATGFCGPLASPVRPNVWYTVRVRAQKGDAGTVTLELAADTGRVIDSRSCDAQPLGGGGFTHAVVGSGNTFGATGDIVFGDVEVLGPSG